MRLHHEKKGKGKITPKIRIRKRKKKREGAEPSAVFVPSEST